METSGTVEPAASDAWLGTWQAVAVGLAGLVGEALLLLLLPTAAATLVTALLITMIYGVYFGFALMRGGVAAFAIETAFMVIGVVLAALGVLVAPVLLGVALILHGVWDLLHHHARPLVGVRGIPRWYVPFCVAFDIPAGVLAIVVPASG